TRSAGHRPTAFPWCLDPSSLTPPSAEPLEGYQGAELGEKSQGEWWPIVNKELRICQGGAPQDEGATRRMGPYRRSSSSARRSAVIPEGIRDGGRNVMPMITAMMPMAMDARKSH